MHIMLTGTDLLELHQRPGEMLVRHNATFTVADGVLHILAGDFEGLNEEECNAKLQEIINN